MVIIGGTIPASHHSFPGMEHDRSLFDASSSSSNGGGLSQFVEQRDTNDDEREIEVKNWRFLTLETGFLTDFVEK